MTDFRQIRSLSQESIDPNSIIIKKLPRVKQDALAKALFRSEKHSCL